MLRSIPSLKATECANLFPMPWFTEDAYDFFRELELNNDREWFEKNKKRYETNVKKPMEAFAAEMIPRMKEIDPAIDMTAKSALFRIYRDTRFSKDKRPYKTNAGMHVNSAHKGDLGRPGLYFHIDPRVMGIASGCYMIETPKLKQIRTFISQNLDEFESLLADPHFKKCFGTIAGEKNKILPPDLKAAAQHQPLLFNKQFYYWAEYEVEDAGREDLPEFVMDHMRAAKPMNDFLMRALTP